MVFHGSYISETGTLSLTALTLCLVHLTTSIIRAAGTPDQHMNGVAMMPIVLSNRIAPNSAMMVRAVVMSSDGGVWGCDVLQLRVAKKVPGG